MKSLPEKELFDEMERRLRNYSEDPDDSSWEKIAGALPPNLDNGKRWTWLGRTGGVISVITLLFILTYTLRDQFDNRNSDSHFTASAMTSMLKTFSSDDSKANEEKKQTDPTTDRISFPTTTQFTDGSLATNAESSTVTNSDVQEDEGATRKSGERNVSTSSKLRKTEGKTETANKSIVRKKLISELLRTDLSSNVSNKITKRSNKNDRKSEPQPIVNGYTSEHKDESEVKTSTTSNQNSNTNVVAGRDLPVNNEVYSIMDQSGNDVNGIEVFEGRNNELPVENNANVTNDSIIKDEKKKLIAKEPEETKDKDKKKKLPKELKPRKKVFKSSVYFNATPSLAYYKLKPNRGDEFTITGLKTSSIFSSNRIGLSFEAGFQRQLTDRFEFYSGLSFYTQHQEIVYYSVAENEATVDSEPGDLVFSVTPGTTKEHSIDYSMRNVGISTGFFYRIKDGMLQHKIGAGLQYQKGLGGGDKVTYNNSTSSYVNYQLAYRLELQYTKRLSFYLQPNINHVIRSNEKLKEPFDIKPYRAGISLGVNYRF